jgi:hypothetical protein
VKKSRIYIIIAILLCVAGMQESEAQALITNLRCESIEKPPGLDTFVPCFTYNIDFKENFAKEAYQVSVVKNPELLEKSSPDFRDPEKVPALGACSMFPVMYQV